MAVEGCGSYSDEDFYTRSTGFSSVRNWNDHMIVAGGNNISHLVRGYPMQGWGEMKSQIVPMGGSAGGSVEAKTDSDGESSVTGEVHVSVKDDDGNKISVSAEGSVKSDGDGNVKSDGKIKVSVDKDF